MIFDKVRQKLIKEDKLRLLKNNKIIKTLKERKIIVIFLLCLVLSVLAIFSSGVSNVFYGYAIKELPIYSVEREDKVVALSFDCAWGTEYTQKMLDVFDFYNIKVTYFAVEFWVQKNSDFVKIISDKGHTIGTHSKTHSYMSKLSKSQIIEELQSSTKCIESITNKKVELFRPPYGDYNNNLILTAKEMGLFTIQWDVDSLDWKDISCQEIAVRVLKKVKNGSICLFHNNGTNTLASLEIIIPSLINRGFSFVTIDNLIYKNNYYIKSDGTQVKTFEKQ